jgi:hypothetical protein
MSSAVDDRDASRDAVLAVPAVFAVPAVLAVPDVPVFPVDASPVCPVAATERQETIAIVRKLFAPRLTRGPTFHRQRPPLKGKCRCSSVEVVK